MIIGAGDQGQVALVPRFKKSQFEVHVISHRNEREEEHERTTQRRCHLKQALATHWLVAQNDHPGHCGDQSDRKPEKVSELLHHYL
jgi:predicted dinucleotide-binding enzyme